MIHLKENERLQGNINERHGSRKKSIYCIPNSCHGDKCPPKPFDDPLCE